MMLPAKGPAVFDRHLVNCCKRRERGCRRGHLHKKAAPEGNPEPRGHRPARMRGRLPRPNRTPPSNPAKFLVNLTRNPPHITHKDLSIRREPRRGGCDPPKAIARPQAPAAAKRRLWRGHPEPRAHPRPGCAVASSGRQRPFKSGEVSLQIDVRRISRCEVDPERGTAGAAF